MHVAPEQLQTEIAREHNVTFTSMENLHLPENERNKLSTFKR